MTPAQKLEYDDLLPVSLHLATTGEYHLLDRHNDEIATFDRALELNEATRIVALINAKVECDIQWTGLRLAIIRLLEFKQRAEVTLAKKRPFAMSTVKTEWKICQRDIADILKI